MQKFKQATVWPILRPELIMLVGPAEAKHQSSTTEGKLDTHELNQCSRQRVRGPCGAVQQSRALVWCSAKHLRKQGITRPHSYQQLLPVLVTTHNVTSACHSRGWGWGGGGGVGVGCRYLKQKDSSVSQITLRASQVLYITTNQQLVWLTSIRSDVYVTFTVTTLLKYRLLHIT